MFSRRLAVVLALAAAGCSTGESRYVGRWNCTAGGGDFFEITSNGKALLVTDETGGSLPAAVDAQGVLRVDGVPFVGTAPLPIDDKTGQLLCAICGCKAYTKARTEQAAGSGSQ